jgi:hypothetical protein
MTIRDPDNLPVGDGAASGPREALVDLLGHGAAAGPREALVDLLGDGATALPEEALVNLVEDKSHGGELHVDGFGGLRSR